MAFGWLNTGPSFSLTVGRAGFRLLGSRATDTYSPARMVMVSLLALADNAFPVLTAELVAGRGGPRAVGGALAARPRAARVGQSGQPSARQSSRSRRLAQHFDTGVEPAETVANRS